MLIVNSILFVNVTKYSFYDFDLYVLKAKKQLCRRIWSLLEIQWQLDEEDDAGSEEE